VAKTRFNFRSYFLLPLFIASLAFPAFAQQAAQTQKPAAGAHQKTDEVKIDFNRRVRMRDGIELSANVYRPDAPGRFPVILSRTPYTKTGSSSF